MDSRLLKPRRGQLKWLDGAAAAMRGGRLMALVALVIAVGVIVVVTVKVSLIIEGLASSVQQLTSH
ncbi:MAG: hypothetical protein ABI934_06265 [Actinomycetota bacterium]